MRCDRQNQFVIAGISLSIAGFVVAGIVSTYFTVILPGFQMLFVITGLRYSGMPLTVARKQTFVNRAKLQTFTVTKKFIFFN